MISRCPLGLPVRIREDGTTDFTDSAFLSGMLNLFGDVDRKYAYVSDDNTIVRHPKGDLSDERVTRSENTSRDQLVAWASTPAWGDLVRATMINYATKWFINKDFLAPHVRFYLFKQAGARAPLYLYPLGFLWMFFDLLISHAIVPRFQKVKDQHEINQALCLYNAFGFAKLLLWLHPTPDENMKDYYTRWRNQGEIYEMYLKWKENL